MTPYYQDDLVTLWHGDCMEVMPGIDMIADAIVTDPPYGLGFMGKAWDSFAESPNEVRWNKRQRNLEVEKSNYGTTGVSFADPNPRCARCGKVRQGTAKYICQCGDDWTPAPRENRQAQRSQAWHQQWAEAAYRVAKPSAYLLAFGGTRTVHRMTVALEDAGWIIRDMLVWAYASGFPKSKASLKPAWEPIVMARKPGPLRDLAIDACRIGVDGGGGNGLGSHFGQPTIPGHRFREGEASADRRYTDAGSTDIAALPGPRGGDPMGRWPANVILTDPIFDGGIEGVVGGGESWPLPAKPWTGAAQDGAFAGVGGAGVQYTDSGTYSRFFLIPRRYNETCASCGLASDAVDRFYLPSPSGASAPSHAQTAAFPGSDTTTDSTITSAIAIGSLSDDAANTPSTRRSRRRATSPASEPLSSPARFPDAASPAIDTTTITPGRWMCGTCVEATTSAITSPSPESRNYPFAFLIPKADRAEREPILSDLPRVILKTQGKAEGWSQDANGGHSTGDNRRPRANVHPTVKPVDLMRHLVRLVTPSGGTVLDPFLGSGTTGIACEMEGFDWIGIEREAEYVRIAEARLVGVQRGFGLSA